MASTGPAVAQASSAGAKVAVASRLPNDLILRGYKPSKEIEAVAGTSGQFREVVVHRPTGDEATIFGTMVRFGMTPPILVNGARVTRNVPKDLWDNWYESNKGSDIVRNHLIFAAEQADRVADWAKEHQAAKSGLEGIDPQNPGAKVRGIHRGDPPK